MNIRFSAIEAKPSLGTTLEWAKDNPSAQLSAVAQGSEGGNTTAEKPGNSFFQPQPFPEVLEKPKGPVGKIISGVVGLLYPSTKMDFKERQLNNLLDQFQDALDKGQVEVKADFVPWTKRLYDKYSQTNTRSCIGPTQLTIRGQEYVYNSTYSWHTNYEGFYQRMNDYFHQLAKPSSQITLKLDRYYKTVTYTDNGNQVSIQSTNRHLRSKAKRLMLAYEKRLALVNKAYHAKQKADYNARLQAMRQTVQALHKAIKSGPVQFNPAQLQITRNQKTTYHYTKLTVQPINFQVNGKTYRLSYQQGGDRSYSDSGWTRSLLMSVVELGGENNTPILELKADLAKTYDINCTQNDKTSQFKDKKLARQIKAIIMEVIGSMEAEIKVQEMRKELEDRERFPQLKI